MEGRFNYRTIPTKNKATYSRIILLMKKHVFACIMAIYDEKDSLKSRYHVYAHVNTGKTK